MQLSKARIKNFRSLRDIIVNFDSHTVFVGGNGAGKSSILKAIEKFYSTSKNLEPDDFFGRDQSANIEIELTFSNLTSEEVETFDERVRDGQLVVTRIFDGTSNSGRYFGEVPLNRDFLPVWAETAASQKRNAYNELRRTSKYEDLPAVTSASQVEEALKNWENSHPNELVLSRDSGQFFGFQNASRGALQRFTSFVFVPAVRDASADATDAKSSVIGKLLEIIVRSAILERKDVASFQAAVNEKYKELTSPQNMPELGELAQGLTSYLRELYADAVVNLTWRDASDMTIPLPIADVALSADGFSVPVDRQGHGLQRAFIFTLLQHLAKASKQEKQENEPTDEPITTQAPNLILAIEEPELYQHPTKQRHFATVLRKLSNGKLPGTDGRTQIAFASHSPMFVSLPNVGELRFVRRVPCDDVEFKRCDLSALDLSTIASKLEIAHNKPSGTYTASSLAPKLHILGAELSEGFFAEAVVLVEGRSDKAALSAAALMMGLNFEAAGIAILPVEGKTNMDKPLLIFRELGIPTYPIWDCDTHKKAQDEQNLSLIRASDPDSNHQVPPTSTNVTKRYAHFSATLEHTLKEDLSNSVFEESLAKACQELDVVVHKDAQKSPEVMRRLLTNANERGHKSETLEKLLRAIWLELKVMEV